MNLVVNCECGETVRADDVGELVWSALYRDDIDPVHSRFDASLAWSLPPPRLRPESRV